MAEPKVRFKRDDGSNYPKWEQGRFGDLIEVYDEKVTSDCTLPVLTSSKADGIQYQSDHFGREQLHDITGYNVIPRGYCTYRNRSDGTDFTFNINNLCDRGIVSKFYPVFHTTSRCNLYFLMTLMNNEPKTVRKIAMTAKGTGQKVLSFLDLQKIEINIPSLEEQQKIADFLSSVDEVITTSEEEVANLEAQKKVVMKKIFSQEVRFKKADGSGFPEWEEKKLGDVGAVLMCKRVLKEQTTDDGDIPFFKIGTFGGVPDAFISRELYEELKSKYSYPKKGNILLSAAGTIGRAVIFNGEEAYYQDSNIVWVDHDDSLSDEYLYQFYSFTSWDNLEGGTVKRLYNGILLDKDINLPCLEEQRLIADFLSDFDEAIAAAKKELELWKLLKKGLLQQMFV